MQVMHEKDKEILKQLKPLLQEAEILLGGVSAFNIVCQAVSINVISAHRIVEAELARLQKNKNLGQK